MVELKQLALKYEFGVFLEEVLWDRLVCGLKNIQIQKKLLAERELTFERAFETAQSMEFANKEGIRDVITTGDKSGNKVDKVVGNMVVVFVPAKTCSVRELVKDLTLPRCAMRNVTLTTRVLLRMFHRQIVLLMKC